MSPSIDSARKTKRNISSYEEIYLYIGRFRRICLYGKIYRNIFLQEGRRQEQPEAAGEFPEQP